jgi:hypothetical protein
MSCTAQPQTASALHSHQVITPLNNMKPSLVLLAAVLLLSLVVVDCCNDVSPPARAGETRYPCWKQKGWNKCSESWMAGYCQVSCGTCGSPHTAPPHDTAAALHIDAAGDRRDYTLHSYGPAYKARKAAVLSAIKRSGVNSDLQKLFFAIGMLETNSFLPKDRDTKKTGDSTNYSQFNINRDLIGQVGLRATSALNQWSGLSSAVNVLKVAEHKLGVNGFLNFLRGGSKGYANHVSYDCKGYRNAIASMLKEFDRTPSLLTDARRIDIEVKHE